MNPLQLAKKAFSNPGYTLQQALLMAGNKLNPWLSAKKWPCFPPRQLFFLLTFQSDFKSQTSVMWGTHGFCHLLSPEELKAELPLEKLQEVLEDVSLFKPEIVVFGPEPLQSPICLPFLRTAKTKGFKTMLVTEGFLLKDHALALIRLCDQIVVQIDGVEEICDQVKGIPGAFARIWEGIQAIEQERSRNPQLRLKLIVMLTRENESQLERIIGTIKASGVQVDALLLEEMESIESAARQKHAAIFQKAFSSPLLFWKGCPPKEKLNWQKIERTVAQQKLHTPFPIQLVKQPRRMEKLKCKAIFSSARILPDGRVWICPDFSIGNIQDLRFKALWNNERARTFRQHHLTHQNFPACAGCHGLR